MRLSLFFVLFALAGRAVPGEPLTPAGTPSVASVDTVKYEWTDPRRHRSVPVKIYFPKSERGPFPMLIFSHGLGGTRENYEYLGRYWASKGYVCVHPQHLGSDDAVWKDPKELLRTMRGAAANPQNAIDRPADVSFAIDQMLKLNAEESPFHARLNTNAIGVAGHSFGAYTTLAVAGQVVGLTERSFRDSRVKAAVAMSSPVPRLAIGMNTRKIYSPIDIPILHMTGTEDSSPIGDTTPSQRRIPFDHIQAPQYLITFTGGDHMIFAGRWLSTVGDKGARFQNHIQTSSTAFWDAFLKNDSKAKAWLAEGAFEKILATDGRFEQKR